MGDKGIVLVRGDIVQPTAISRIDVSCHGQLLVVWQLMWLTRGVWRVQG